MAEAIIGHVYAQILNGKAHWIFTADDLLEWAEGTGNVEIQTVDITDLSPRPQVGWLYADGVLKQPQPVAPAVPQEVTRFQALAALHLAGMLEAVEAMMADSATDRLTVLAWQNAQEFKRHSPLVLSMAQALGLSEQQLDELFVAATKIE